MWNGTISFGLVTIPVSLYPATKSEELSFKLLRKSDQSPVNYKRVAQADGKEVAWEEIVKGYEYEKGKFVILKDEDFKRVDLEAAAQTIDIMDFVELEQINPMYFQKPYYLEPQKGGDKAYALLRDALNTSGKIGIAKVIIRTREHLAGVKAQGNHIILEIMHFGDELVDSDSLKVPDKDQAKPREVEMAKKLIEGMTAEWEPNKYKDEYKTQLMEMIEEKVKNPDQRHETKKTIKKASNVVDLMSVLEESLRGTKSSKSKATETKSAAKPKFKKAS